MTQMIIDVATAALPDAADYIDTPKPRKGTKDEAKQQAQIAEKLAERLDGAGLDLDLCRITALGTYEKGGSPVVVLCKSEAEERDALGTLVPFFRDPNNCAITFNGLNFDLPVIMRRARYLGVKLPKINIDRWRTAHVDVANLLSDNNPDRRRSLGFYAKRLGMGLSKPLSGAEESRVFETQDWAGLEASVVHDLTATYKLAEWLGVL